MSKNKVQFQEGFSLAKFYNKYGKEYQCWQALYKYKYPNGFFCFKCEHTEFYKITRGQCLQCKKCNKQHSLRTDTLLENSKLSFRVWFLAIYLISQSKKSTSSLALKRSLGVSYDTAWLVQQKIMHALKNSDDCSALQGVIHVDDGYLGGKHSGVRGRGAKGKQPFLTALSFKDGKPDQLKLSLLKTFSHANIAKWREKNIAEFSKVFSDGLPAFSALKGENIEHVAVNISKNPQEKDGLFMAINTVMGNLKRYILGIHHAVRAHRVARYLSAFAWRFNNRYNLKDAFSNALTTVINQKPHTLFEFKMELSR